MPSTKACFVVLATLRRRAAEVAEVAEFIPSCSISVTNVLTTIYPAATRERFLISLTYSVWSLTVDV